MTISLHTPLEIKLITQTRSGSRIKVPSQIYITPSRIEFLKSPFALKDEIKSMKGSKWHGYEDPPRMLWSVDNCFRNWFQLRYLMGENPYEWFDRPLEHYTYDRPLKEHQCDLSDNGLTYHYQIWAAEMGVGKGGLPTTKVATPDGWTTLGEIQVGDSVINPEGGVTKVKGVYPRGKMEMFRVEFSDGSSTVCSADHLWNVYSEDGVLETLELNEIIARGLYGLNDYPRFQIQTVSPVEYSSKSLPIPAYLVGYLIASGACFQTGNENCVLSCGKSFSPVDKINLPEEYLYTSVQDRLNLLQGLCDKNAGIFFKSVIAFETKSSELKNIFIHLIQSLGGVCELDSGHDASLGFKIFAIVPPGIKPFILESKNNLYKPATNNLLRSFIKIESIGEHECICIAVEAANQLYVTDDYIVTHNTLSAIEVMEKSPASYWWWIGPKSGLYAVEREFKKWDLKSNLDLEIMTYEGLVKRMTAWKSGDKAPMGVVFDESSRLKTANSQRTQAAQSLADGIRTDWGTDGYVILMSGTPSPKSPIDWWAQAEIAWPGFLKEGSADSFKFRLGIHKKEEGTLGNSFYKLVNWKDTEERCEVCGELKNEGEHKHLLEDDALNLDAHDFVACTNEVALLHERLQGLVVVKHKKDCLDLPDKHYRIIQCKPSASTLRVASSLVKTAPNTITGLTWLRELSDGFQYRQKIVGNESCPVCNGSGVCEYWIDPNDSEKLFTMLDMLDAEYVKTLQKTSLTCTTCRGAGEIPKYERIVKEIPCPKEQVLCDLLDENEECGRLVVFAGFTGSIDRITKTCLKRKWDVVRVDGRGWLVYKHDGTSTHIKPLDYWADLSNNPRVCFVAHPKSGGMSLTLTEARMVVFYSNDFTPESRAQAEDRIHRMGLDLNKGATITDIIHLPSDDHVLGILKANRRLELMTLGEFEQDYNGVEPDEV
jgi:hypothetical protein